MSASLLPEAALAGSRTSTTIDGRTVTVVGGSNQSVRSTEGETVVVLDGRKIVIRDGRIAFDGAVHRVGHFTELEIRASGDRIDIIVDGRPIE